MSFNPLVVAFLTTLFTLLILMASGGNLLVCAAVFFDRKLRKQTENLFLISLAISDLLVAVLVMIFAAANDLLGYWLFGDVYCSLWICFDITLCTASILNLCAISFDRYFHISSPMIYIEHATTKRISLIIVFVWILSIAIGSLQLVFKKEPVLPQETNLTSPLVINVDNLKPPSCTLKLKPEFAIISSTVSFFLPATVMVLAYSRLYLYARKHVRCIRSQLAVAAESLLQQSTRLSCPNVMEPKGANGRNNNRGSPVKNRHKQQEISDQKARVTLGVIMGTFLLCWLPFFCVNIWRSFHHSAVPNVVFIFVTWLGYANSTANPIIYSIFNRDFRRAFSKILLKSVSCVRRKLFRHSGIDSNELSSVIPFGERIPGFTTFTANNGERTPINLASKSPSNNSGRKVIFSTYGNYAHNVTPFDGNSETTPTLPEPPPTHLCVRAPMAVIRFSQENHSSDVSLIEELN